MNERITTCGIYMKDNSLLMGKRLNVGHFNNRWEFIGGKHRYGENPETTLKREFLEELGVPVTVGKFLGSISFTNNGTCYHLKAYEVTPRSDQYTLCVHSEVKMIPISSMDTIEIVPSDYKLFCEIRNLF